MAKHLHVMESPPMAMTSGGVYPYDEATEKRYTMLSKYGDTVSLFKRQGDNLILPRRLSGHGGDDRRTSGCDINVTDGFIPRSKEQSRVANEVEALLKKGESHICQCPTGFGKTYIGATAIARVKKKTLIILTKEDIKSQWVSALIDVMKIPKSRIGLIQGDKIDVVDKDVVLTMVQSICKDGRYPKWVYKEFGLIVIDEVHRMGADYFSNAMWALPAKLRLGLSASPHRKDGKDVVFKSHLGQVLVKSEAVPLVPKIMTFRYRAKVPKMPVKAGRTAHVDRILSRDPIRNKILAGYMALCHKKGRSPVFFSSRTEHLQTMHDLLVSRGVPANSIGFYVGGLKDEQREAAKRKDVVMATYQMASEATDAPWWDVAILGTPRSDVLQIAGRVLREYEGKCNAGEETETTKAPIILDVEDTNPPLFMRYTQSRRKFYGTLGAPIHRITVESFL